jgi:hypothetical protein
MIAAAVLVAAVAAVLFVPVRVELDYDTRRNPSMRPVRLHLRWWVVGWRTGKVPRKRPPVAPCRRSASVPGDAPHRQRLLVALASRGFMARVLRLGTELLRAVAPRGAQGYVRLGFDDPASTGLMFGLMHGLSCRVRSADWRLDVEPEFTGSTFAARLRVKWSVRPASLLWPLATFVASPATWRAGAALIGLPRPR